MNIINLKKQRGKLIQPKINDVVLVEDENLKRMDWKIGKIEELIQSKDGEIRSAKIVTITNGKKSYMRRPINKLYPIESNIEDEEVKLKFVNDSDTKIIKGAGGV